MNINPPAPAVVVPLHWTPEQALAVFECLQAWRDQLVPDGQPPEFDPDEPF